jgi:hypothetical protein
MLFSALTDVATCVHKMVSTAIQVYADGFVDNHSQHPSSGNLTERADERTHGYAPAFSFRLDSELICCNACNTSLVPASAGPKGCGRAVPSERDDVVRREGRPDWSMLATDVRW